METFDNWNAEDEIDFRLFDLTSHENIVNGTSEDTFSKGGGDGVIASHSNNNSNNSTNNNNNTHHNAQHNKIGALSDIIGDDTLQHASRPPSTTSSYKRLNPDDLDAGHKTKKRDVTSHRQANSAFSKKGSHAGQGQYPRSSFYIGLSLMYDSILIDHMRLNGIDQVQLTPCISLRKVDAQSRFLLREDYTDELYNQSAKDLDDIESIVRPYGPILVDMYFKFIHPFYPILHKKVFLEKYERGFKEVSAPLLSAVYLILMELWENEAKLIGRQKPDAGSLYAIAKKTFLDVLERPKLTAVQAGLLLLQCNKHVPCSENGTSRKWVLCSQVVSLIEELGLGVDCGTWKLPKWEKGLRRRLAWAAFFQDKWISLVESRPSHLIPGINWLINDLTDDDFLESNSALQPARTSPASSVHSMMHDDNKSDIGKHFFMQLSKLAKLVSEILTCFYSLSATRNPNNIEKVLDYAKPLQLKLRGWHAALPFNLLNPPDVRSLHLPADAHPPLIQASHRAPNLSSYLKLAYFIAEITLHRKIITTLTNDEPKELIEVCRTAAKTRVAAAIDFISQLKPENIHSFWYSTASSDFTIIGTFAMILYVTSSDPLEKAYYKDQLFNFRWCLKIISKNFFHAWQALKQFDSIYLQIPELLSDSPNNKPQPVENEVTRQQPPPMQAMIQPVPSVNMNYPPFPLGPPPQQLGFPSQFSPYPMVQSPWGPLPPQGEILHSPLTTTNLHFPHHHIPPPISHQMFHPHVPPAPAELAGSPKDGENTDYFPPHRSKDAESKKD